MNGQNRIEPRAIIFVIAFRQRTHMGPHNRIKRTMDPICSIQSQILPLC